MKNKLFFILSMAAIIITQSCLVSDTIRGNKNIVNEEIDVSDYAEIYFAVPGEIIYLQTPDKTPYLQIITDENIFSLLEIETTGSSLKIKCRKNTNIRPSRLTIYAGSSHLNKVELTGSGRVHLKEKIELDNMTIRLTGSGNVVSDDLSCEKTNLTVTGSGNIELKGTCDELSCNVTGSGDIDVLSYPARNVDCLVTGSGDALTCVKDKLTAKVTGSGSIKYKGNPPETNIRVTGSGNIKQIK